MKVGWPLVFIVSIVILINGLILLLTGSETDAQLFENQAGVAWNTFASSDQGIVTYVESTLRITGVVSATAGVFAVATTYSAFRKGERWALYVLSLGALGLVYVTADEYLAGGSMWPVYLILLVVDFVGLLLPFRTFFPKQRGALG